MLKLSFDGAIVTFNWPYPKAQRDGSVVLGRHGRCFQKIDDNDEIRVAVLSAEGRAFSVGLDLFDVMPSHWSDWSRRSSTKRSARLIRRWQDGVTAVERCRVPVVAAVQGYCLGVARLITACDIGSVHPMPSSVCEKSKWGSSPTSVRFKASSSHHPGLARELVFTGQDFDAAYAQTIGLVNHVCPVADEAVEHAFSIAKETRPMHLWPLRFKACDERNHYC